MHGSVLKRRERLEGLRILGDAGDICKLDFGVQVRGRIIDCAFSIAFDSKFDPLIQATQVKGLCRKASFKLCGEFPVRGVLLFALCKSAKLRFSPSFPGWNKRGPSRGRSRRADF